MNFFFLLLYANELSDEMEILCCGNVLQNKQTNKQTENTVLLKVTVFKGW